MIPCTLFDDINTRIIRSLPKNTYKCVYSTCRCVRHRGKCIFVYGLSSFNHIDGLGLFAAQEILEGEIVGVYKGKVYASGKTKGEVHNCLDKSGLGGAAGQAKNLLMIRDEDGWKAIDPSKSRVMELINDPMGCPFGPNAIYYEDGTIEAIKYIPAFDFREPWKSEILCSYGDSYWRDNIIYSIVIGQGMSRLL